MDFLREKLTAHNYVFSDKTFPAIAFDRPSEAEDEIGSFHLNTTFYDADFKPVKTADRPGRYGAVVEVVTRAGVVNRRYQTLYRAPGNVDWRTAFLGARVGLARAIGVDDGIAWEQTLASSEVYRRVLANSLTTEDSLAVLFCALAETHAGDVGARYQNVSRRNDAWWVGLKKSIGQFQPYQYVIHLPPGYSANGGKHWPLILFLHGSDPHSDTLDLIRTQGLCAYAIAHRELPFVVISPATPPGTRISTATLTTLLDDVMQQYDVDPDRVYVTGLSLGGFGTWDLAAQTPERFAAAVPIAGFGDPNDALRLKNLPMWVFHGDADPTVPIGEDERSVAALQTVGGRVKFTVYAGVVHDSWTRTYANPELYRWLLQQRRGAPTQAPATQPTTAPTTRSVPW
jgi:poly(3-hydroxybutyrate) depolymerase